MKPALFALILLLPVGAFAATDVKTLGLKADGATDDTAALQAALDGGQTDLTFPKGEYLLGAITLPADTHLQFSPEARIKISREKLTFREEVEGRKRAVIRTRPFLQVKGDRVVIEGLSFDFASGGDEKNPTPVEELISAEGVSELHVTGVSAENSSDKATRDSRTLLVATDCRHVVLENSHAQGLSHMMMARGCANVTVRGNWMIGGADMTSFSGGGECLRHHDNWSRQVGYQCVWRGGSPDPSRKAPRVPLGSANVVQRGLKPGDPAYIAHTEGVFDVIVKNNYAEYGTTLCWGNKGRQTIIEGNIARFMFDYAYGTEGGENLVFANNISINSAVAGICSLYWGEKLSVTGNLVIVRHEPFDAALAKRPESTYFGQFIRLHHGPTNPEDKYGAGGVQISGNTFINELGDRPSGISIEAGRDVLLSHNKIVNGLVRKHDELSVTKAPSEKTAADGDEFTSQEIKTVEPEAPAGAKVARRVGTDLSRVTILGNEFISRRGPDKPCVIIDGTVSSAIVKDNIFRQEATLMTLTAEQRELETHPPRYTLYARDDLPVKDLSSSTPPAAITLAPFTSCLSIVQGNLVCGWKEAIRAGNGSPTAKSTFLVTHNTMDGQIAVEAPSARTQSKVENNVEMPAGFVPSPTEVEK